MNLLVGIDRLRPFHNLLEKVDGGFCETDRQIPS